MTRKPLSLWVWSFKAFKRSLVYLVKCKNTCLDLFPFFKYFEAPKVDLIKFKSFLISKTHFPGMSNVIASTTFYDFHV